MANNEQSQSARRPVAVDIFAGVGGLGLGFEQAGFDILAAVEHDPIHAKVHKFNFPWTEVLTEDAASLSGSAIKEAARRGYAAHGYSKPWDGTIDVVIGGPPCQGFSHGGTHSSRDPRNKLLKVFARFVKELKPRYFVMENVPGLLSPRHKHRIRTLLSSLRGAGYEVLTPTKALNAADYGVPQDRTRVFVLGWRKGEVALSYPSPKTRRPEVEGDSVACLPLAPNVMDAIRDLPEPGEENVVTWCRSLSHQEQGVASRYVRELNGEDPQDFSYRRTRDDGSLCGCESTRHSDAAARRFAATEPGMMETVSRFRRLAATGLCNTLRAGTGPDHGSHTPPRPIHPFVPRVISVREAARLHSFPDWFRFHCTKWHAWREIGNSVPPLAARAIGSEVLLALGAVATIPTRRLPKQSPGLLGYEAGSDAVIDAAAASRRTVFAGAS